MHDDGRIDELDRSWLHTGSRDLATTRSVAPRSVTLSAKLAPTCPPGVATAAGLEYRSFEYTAYPSKVGIVRGGGDQILLCRSGFASHGQ